MKNSGNGKSHKGNAREDQVKKDRKSGSGMNGSPKKGGHGGKFTWAGDQSYSTTEMGLQNEVIDAKDPNFEHLMWLKLSSLNYGYPVYHSRYDDFVWMEKFGDPFFHRHVAVASLWGLIALQLADAEFLPFDYTSYALELQKYMKDLEIEISDKNINLIPLFKSIEELKKAARLINNQRREIEQNNGWPSIRKKDHFKVRELNDRLMMAERAFTDQHGLFGRSWYKHLVYGPSKNDDYGSKSFPGVDEAIEKAKRLNTVESWKLVQHEVWRVARAVRHAAKVINGVLT